MQGCTGPNRPPASRSALARLGGRPGGFRLDSRPSAAAVRFTQRSAPNGVPRSPLRARPGIPLPSAPPPHSPSPSKEPKHAAPRPGDLGQGVHSQQYTGKPPADDWREQALPAERICRHLYNQGVFSYHESQPIQQSGDVEQRKGGHRQGSLTSWTPYWVRHIHVGLGPPDQVKL